MSAWGNTNVKGVKNQKSTILGYYYEHFLMYHYTVEVGGDGSLVPSAYELWSKYTDGTKITADNISRSLESFNGYAPSKYEAEEISEQARAVVEELIERYGTDGWEFNTQRGSHQIDLVIRGVYFEAKYTSIGVTAGHYIYLDWIKNLKRLGIDLGVTTRQIYVIFGIRGKPSRIVPYSQFVSNTTIQ